MYDQPVYGRETRVPTRVINFHLNVHSDLEYNQNQIILAIRKSANCLGHFMLLIHC